MLLGVSCLFNLASERLEDGLEICIDDERRHGAKLEINEFELRLFGAWRCEHMEN